MNTTKNLVSLAVELPLPAEELHPNRSKGRSRLASIIRSKKVKEARGTAMMLAKMKFPSDQQFTGKVRFDAHFYLPRKRDDDGLFSWLKPSRDGIADAGIVKNDSQFQVGEATQTTGRNVERKVIITLTGELKFK